MEKETILREEEKSLYVRPYTKKHKPLDVVQGSFLYGGGLYYSSLYALGLYYRY